MLLTKRVINYHTNEHIIRKKNLLCIKLQKMTLSNNVLYGVPNSTRNTKVHFVDHARNCERNKDNTAKAKGSWVQRRFPFCNFDREIEVDSIEMH